MRRADRHFQLHVGAGLVPVPVIDMGCEMFGFKPEKGIITVLPLLIGSFPFLVLVCLRLRAVRIGQGSAVPLKGLVRLHLVVRLVDRAKGRDWRPGDPLARSERAVQTHILIGLASSSPSGVRCSG